jgi:hypothetical protein
MMYTALRDLYLVHVANCSSCRRFLVNFNEDGELVWYFSIWQPCPIRKLILARIEALF